MYRWKLALIAAVTVIAGAATSPSASPRNAPPFKCIVAPFVDSLLSRWSRGDIDAAVSAFGPEGSGGFSSFAFGPVTAAHRTDLAARLAQWHPEPGLRVLDFRIVNFESEDVMNVGSVRIGNNARPRAYDATLAFNCRTSKFVSIKAAVPAAP
jgi:hypothetical protein